MKPIDIINVAGLLMDGKNDGIEDELRLRVQPRSLKTIAPVPLGSAMEHPEHAIQRAVQMIQETIHELEGEFGESRVVLIGRSYGAFIALLAAVRMDFQKILKAVLIEGPLHPNVVVHPPALLPPLMTCGVHYKARPDLAREAVDRVKVLGAQRIVMIQGCVEDSVVPVDSQVIPGNFEVLEMTEKAIRGNAFVHGQRGVVAKLPAYLGGRMDGMKKLFPEGYRNHLFWSEEKMRTVQEIIAKVAESLD